MMYNLFVHEDDEWETASYPIIILFADGDVDDLLFDVLVGGVGGEDEIFENEGDAFSGL